MQDQTVKPVEDTKKPVTEGTAGTPPPVQAEETKTDNAAPAP